MPKKNLDLGPKLQIQFTKDQNKFLNLVAQNIATSGDLEGANVSNAARIVTDSCLQGRIPPAVAKARRAFRENADG